MALDGVLMDTAEGQEVWRETPPGPDDIVTIDDDREFGARQIPQVLLEWGSRGLSGLAGRVFCFVDPDDAVRFLGALPGMAMPRLILVDMVFGSVTRGPEIIDRIRRRTLHSAIIGYSAQRDLVVRGDVEQGVVDGATASIVGADEWFDKGQMVDAEFRVDPTPFFECVVRAVERRQTFVRELESRLTSVHHHVDAWSLSVLSECRAEGQLTAPQLAERLGDLLSIPEREFQPGWRPRPLWLHHHGREVDLQDGRRRLTLSATSDPKPARDEESGALWALLQAHVERSRDVLAATASEEERRDAGARVTQILQTATERTGLRTVADRLQSTVAAYGRSGRQSEARALSYLARVWIDDAPKAETSNDPDGGLWIGLAAFLRAAQGQAAAELGLEHEAREYLTVALADADHYDIPYVGDFARKALYRLAQNALASPSGQAT